MRRRLFCVSALTALALPGLRPARAIPPAREQIASRFFTSSDGVRLHYFEAGSGPTIVFVPGWTMPAWIWWLQLEFFSRQYHVVAFDPRGQGESQAPEEGYEPGRRGQDIGDLLAHLGGRPALLVGWSLGVLDTLAYVHTHGDARIAGLVLVDNSVGEDPPPPVPPPPPKRPWGFRPPRIPPEVATRRFVAGMFHKPTSPVYIDRLTEASLITPEPARRALLSYREPRTYWREAVYSTAKPVLYAVTPRFAAQAANLTRRHPAAEAAVFDDAGHALFVDDEPRFDALLADFIRRRIWPA